MEIISDRMINQTYSDLKKSCGGSRSDYFGLCYLETELGISRPRAVQQVAFGGNDFGLSGFHFDLNRRNLYLFQFNPSLSASEFKKPLERLIDNGMERIFLRTNERDEQNELLLRLWNGLVENRQAIDQVFFHFVFRGNAEEAERSQVLDKLREDLEDKKHVIDKFFGDRAVKFFVEFRSTGQGVALASDHKSTHQFNIPVTELIMRSGPAREQMVVGFVRLVDLFAMHKQMGQRFFKRNIRFGLGNGKSINRVLAAAFKSILLEGKQSPAAFAFNHNGITLFAEQLQLEEGALKLTEPRVLNGAQTVTVLTDFLKSNANHPKLVERRQELGEMQVLCRIVTEAHDDFVTTVTINNNRQNPVKPWNLRANEMILLQLQDMFRETLGIYFERQENAFATLLLHERERLGIVNRKPIGLLKLTQTYLITDGQLDRLARMREVFEDDRLFARVFHEGRLKADLRLVVLCYKIQFRLKKLVGEIADKGPNKYWFMSKANALLWALLCQALFNDDHLEKWIELYGRRLRVEADFTHELARLATTRCRILISALVADPAFSEKAVDPNLSFLRTNSAYRRCIEIASDKWNWVEKRLK